MMSVLVPFLPYDLRETPMSFATRLASFHLGGQVVPFLHDIGVCPEALAGCEFDTIEQIAGIAGVDSTALHRNSAHRTGKRRFNLRGNPLTSEFFSSPAIIFCPACLREDDNGAGDVASARIGRMEWTLMPVRSCPIHGLALVHRKKQLWNDKYRQLALVVSERGAELDRLVDTCAQQTPSQLQNYVLERLDGRRGPEWLDNQTLEQAVRVTEVLGMRVRFGASKNSSDMRPDEWNVAGDVGYQITAGGEAAIRDAFSQMQAEFRGRTGKPGCRAIFGSFYNTLASKRNAKDFGDFKRILREHIVDTMDVEVGQNVLGVTVTERRLHSVQSLAKEAGLNPRTLRSVLAARGLIPVEEKISDHHVFDADAGREVAASVIRVTAVSKLGEALGCARPLAEQLVDERILQPIWEGPSSASGRTWKGVDNREIERFLGALVADARPVDAGPAGMVAISKAAEKAKLLGVEIVHLILGGFLKNVARLSDVHGCAGILVDPDEVRAQSRAVLVGMSAFHSFACLKIPRATGWALAERTDEPRLRPSVIEGRNRRHRIYRFLPQTVAEFLSEFTTDIRAANMSDLPKKTVVSQLKRAGVRTVVPYGEIGIYLYRKTDIPELQAA